MAKYIDCACAAQLLCINSIMDIITAIALATEQPAPTLLERHPSTKVLLRFIFEHGNVSINCINIDINIC